MEKNKVPVSGKRKHEQDISKDDVSLESVDAQPQESDDTVSESATEEKRILIVEDDAFLRGLLSHNLSSVNFKVDSALDAETAFKFIGRHLPDIILLDLMLPGMKGFDFLSEIKKTRHLTTPVIVLSNLGSKEDIDTALSLGAIDFMVKANVTPKQIIKKIQSVLDRGI